MTFYILWLSWVVIWFKARYLKFSEVIHYCTSHNVQSLDFIKSVWYIHTKTFSRVQYNSNYSSYLITQTNAWQCIITALKNCISVCSMQFINTIPTCRPRFICSLPHLSAKTSTPLSFWVRNCYFPSKTVGKYAVERQNRTGRLPLVVCAGIESCGSDNGARTMHGPLFFFRLSGDLVRLFRRWKQSDNPIREDLACNEMPMVVEY
jgi:hypothetical protein